MTLKIQNQLTAGSFPLFLNLEIRSSVTFLVGMVVSLRTTDTIGAVWLTDENLMKRSAGRL